MAADDRLIRAGASPCGPNSTGERAVLAALAVYVVGLCLLPLLRLLAEAAGPDGFAEAAHVLSSDATLRATQRTVVAGLGATAVSVLLGAGLALAVTFVDLRARGAIVFLVLLPMLVPAQIAALAWLELTGPSSSVLGPLGLAPAPGTRNWLYSGWGIALLMGIEHMPIVFLAVRAGLRAVPGDVVEAARAAGAGPSRTLALVVLPLLRPALLAGTALAFVAAVGNFGIPAILGIPGRYSMLTALIYQRLSGFGPSVLGEVAVLSLLLALIAGAGLAVQALADRRGPVALSGAHGPVRPWRLGRLRGAATLTVLAILLPLCVAPLVALLGTSLIKALGVPLSLGTATLEHYATVLENDASRRAFVNSAWLSGAAAFATLVVAVPFAHALTVRRTRLVRALNLVADAPFALPGIVVSIAFILAFLRPLPIVGIGLYGTGVLILLAYLARFLALGLRPVVAAMAGLDPALEEAGRIAGAGPLRRLWSIVLPRVAPAAVAGALLIVMSAYNELTVSVLLWSQGNETVGVQVFNLYDEGNATAAAAASVLSILVTLCAAVLATVTARWLPKGTLPWQT